MSTIAYPSRKLTMACLFPMIRRVWRIVTRPPLGAWPRALSMLYFVLPPFLTMLQATITRQPEDVRLASGVNLGEFTLFPWSRVLKYGILRTCAFQNFSEEQVTGGVRWLSEKGLSAA